MEVPYVSLDGCNSTRKATMSRDAPDAGTRASKHGVFFHGISPELVLVKFGGCVSQGMVRCSKQVVVFAPRSKATRLIIDTERSPATRKRSLGIRGQTLAGSTEQAYYSVGTTKTRATTSRNARCHFGTRIPRVSVRSLHVCYTPDYLLVRESRHKLGSMCRLRSNDGTTHLHENRSRQSRVLSTLFKGRGVKVRKQGSLITILFFLSLFVISSPAFAEYVTNSSWYDATYNRFGLDERSVANLEYLLMEMSMRSQNSDFRLISVRTLMTPTGEPMTPERLRNDLLAELGREHLEQRFTTVFIWVSDETRLYVSLPQALNGIVSNSTIYKIIDEELSMPLMYGMPVGDSLFNTLGRLGRYIILATETYPRANQTHVPPGMEYSYIRYHSALDVPARSTQQNTTQPSQNQQPEFQFIQDVPAPQPERSTGSSLMPIVLVFLLVVLAFVILMIIRRRRQENDAYMDYDDEDYYDDEETEEEEEQLN